MATDYRRVLDFLRDTFTTPGSIRPDRLTPRREPAGPRVPGGSSTTEEAIAERWELPGLPAYAKGVLADAWSIEHRDVFAKNVENFIGTARLPIGLAGPLRVNGLHAHGDYYVPLATTEAALVASYARGSLVVTESGGCSAIVLNESVSRSPGFAFETLADAGLFLAWAATAFERFQEVAAGTTSHGRLVNMQLTVEGNHAYLGLEFTTGDASGQNMVTIATDAICRFIEQECPVRARHWFVEANMSGDKKATTHSFMSVRGKKVSAEVTIPASVLERRLHTTTDRMMDYWRMSALGGVMTGSIGVHGHYANGIAALFIACGQDAACVAEATVGITRFEPRKDGALYASVTLPNMIVGTVGGGTGLPTQRACLDILGLAGPGKARAFAEIAAALALAGELSITGALAAGHFTRAHQKLARGSAE